MAIEYKQFIIVPKKPKMSVGKVASQVAHASFMGLEYENKELIEEWKKNGMCVIVLQCKDVIQLMGIDRYFNQWDINHWMYVDEGMTEVDMGTPTALATGILKEEQWWMLEQLRLYK